jgi:hypothetical protein
MCVMARVCQLQRVSSSNPCISCTRSLAPETRIPGSADLKQVVSGIEAAFGPAQDYKPSADQVFMVRTLQTHFVGGMLRGIQHTPHVTMQSCIYISLWPDA